jgi:hypothetical protein
MCNRKFEILLKAPNIPSKYCRNFYLAGRIRVFEILKIILGAS